MKPLLWIFILSAFAFSLDDLAIPNSFGSGDTAYASDFNENFDSVRVRVNHNKDTVELRFIRYTDLSGGDSTLSRVQCDTIRSNPHIDSAVIEIITGANQISGNPTVDSIQGMDVIRGNPDVDSISGSPIINEATITDSIDCNKITTDSIKFNANGDDWITTYKDTFFIGTFQGIDGDPTDTVWYTIIGNYTNQIITVHIPQVSGTSDATNFQIENVPAEICATPGTNNTQIVRIEDNGNAAYGFMTVGPSPWEIYPAAGTALWTASGTKTITGSSFTYYGDY